VLLAAFPRSHRISLSLEITKFGALWAEIFAACNKNDHQQSTMKLNHHLSSVTAFLVAVLVVASSSAVDLYDEEYSPQMTTAGKGALLREAVSIEVSSTRSQQEMNEYEEESGNQRALKGSKIASSVQASLKSIKVTPVPGTTKAPKVTSARGSTKAPKAAKR
jgi:hypothetical protein